MTAKTIKEICAQWSRIYSGLCELKKRDIKAAHPETGGIPMLCHNWGNQASRAAMAARERQQDRARAIYTRLYKLAFYRQYPDHIESQKFNNLKNKAA